MARDIKIKILGDERGYNKALRGASNSTKGFANTIGRAGATVLKFGAIVGGVALVAAAGLSKKFVGLAADAEEVSSKFQVIFGKEMPGMIKNLDAFAAATGTSRYELRQQVADLGALLAPLTATKKEAGDLSIQFTKLATDLGSFNNVPTADALLAIRSGLVGEAEPLRRFGVLLNEGAVKAEAYASGIAKVGSELTEQQKVQARANLIMKQTKLAQGDAARTADSFTNQLKKLRNGVKDLSTDMGVLLLPIATKAVTALAGFVTDLSAAKGFKAKLNVVWTNIQAAGQQIGKALQKAVNSVNWAEVWAGAKGVGKALSLAIENQLKAANWGAIGGAIVVGIVAGIKGAVELTQAFVDKIMDAMRATNWIKVGEVMGPGLAQAIATAIKTFLDPVFWVRNWELALSIALIAFGGPIGRFAGWFGKTLGTALADTLWQVAPRLAGRIAGLWGDIVFAFRYAAASLWAWIDKTFAPLLAKKIFDALAKAIDKPKQVLDDFVQWFFNGWRQIEGGVVSFGRRFRGFMARAFTLDVIILQLERWIKQVINWFLGLPGRLYDAAKGIGSGIIQAIMDGLSGKWGELKAWVLGKAGDLVSSLKNKLMFWSSGPDEWARKNLGEKLVMGLLLGTKDMPEKLADRLKESIEKGKTAIADAKSGFAAAFDALTSVALEAFDKMAAGTLTKTEKLLKAMDEKRAKADAAAELRAAKGEKAVAVGELATTVQGEEETDAEFATRYEAAKARVVAAQAALDEVLYQQRRVALERKAALERINLDDHLALNRRHFEQRLAKFQQFAANHNLTAAQMNEGLIKLFEKYKVPFKKSAKDLGLALAEGLEEASAKVSQTASKVRDEIMKYLGSIVIRINIDVQTPKAPTGKARGGPVRANKAYLVGEEGPELFISGSAGHIVPNQLVDQYTSPSGGFGQDLVPRYSPIPSGGGGAIVINVSAGTFIGTDRHRAARELMDIVRPELLRLQGRSGTTGIV